MLEPFGPALAVRRDLLTPKVRNTGGATPTWTRTRDHDEIRAPTLPVEHFSAELAARTSELLDESGLLSVTALAQLVRRIANRPDLWRPLVVVDRDRRRYELLYDDDHVDIWVLSWMPGQRTGFHDHDRSCVGLVCAQGELDGGSLAIGADAEMTRMTPGIARSGPGGYIHAVAHHAGAPAVSIHAYSPPLTCVGSTGPTATAGFSASRSMVARNYRTSRSPQTARGLTRAGD
jgi:predicted metal-dependent enzyme (double-stranded beta helix superfamily)